MAALKTIIEQLVEIKRTNGEGISTKAVASGLYGMTERQFAEHLAERRFAVSGKDGNFSFPNSIDPLVMGRYDKGRKTFLWTNIGIELTVMVLADQGIYPGDNFARLFIGDDDPQEIIINYNNKNLKEKNL